MSSLSPSIPLVHLSQTLSLTRVEKPTKSKMSNSKTPTPDNLPPPLKNSKQPLWANETPN